ncbi:hypothetical protein RSOLAG22IIIB_05693 [Rhizoctonia solani]|uniref:Uncharacterized protein n=1 Tax=Rhizoctonia solani TaxID=456999 RepID=A0A0K6G8R0_9AGAM|nr:hypothetical protein RSOLAG22IIIB_05693 [Rhizoctonia solani]
MADFDEAQAQSQLDELTSHVERAFLELTGTLDSEPEELDEASVDEILDRVERAYGSPGNTAKTSSDLSASNTIAKINAEGKTFSVTTALTSGLSGKAKVWGTLNGRQAYVSKSLPFNFFTVATTDTKGRCVFISTTRHKFTGGVGVGTWS